MKLENQINQIIRKVNALQAEVKDIQNTIVDSISDIAKLGKSKNGQDGKDGKPGKDGRDGKSIKGEKGDPGQPGMSIKGDKGEDGLGFKDASVNEKGELILVRDDKVKINAGIVKGEDGKTIVKTFHTNSIGSDRPYIQQQIAVLRTANSIKQGSFYAASPANGTIPLVPYALYALAINGLYGLKTTSGTITVSIQINGVSVTGLSSVAVTSTPQNVLATALNSMVVGDALSLVLASASSPVGLVFSLKGTT